MVIYLIVTGILFLFYYGILCFYTGKWDSTFARFWLAAGCGPSSSGIFRKGRMDKNSFAYGSDRRVGAFPDHRKSDRVYYV